MRFAFLFTAVTTVISSVAAAPQVAAPEARDEAFNINLDIGSLFSGFDLSRDNYYGAPIPPWKAGHKPGWYYGPNPGKYPFLPCLGGIICKILDYIPFLIHCPHHFPPPPTNPPPPSDGYNQTFHNITAAVQADDYMTFGLVETVADCKAMCNSVSGCKFVNTYHDVNGKDGSPLLTCALFAGCHGEEDADNKGGQTQPDGTINFIIESDGWCKKA